MPLTDLDAPAWREQLLRILEANKARHIEPQRSSGRRRVWIGVLFGIFAAGVQFNVSYWHWRDVEPDVAAYEQELLDAGVDTRLVRQRSAMFRETAESRLEHRQFAAVVLSAVTWPVLVLLYWKLVDKGRRMLASDVYQELDRLPNRRPALFLRSFRRSRPGRSRLLDFFDSDDMLERSLARELRTQYPLVAIGEPTEEMPAIGAARLYLPQNRWQPTVRELMRHCGVLVIVAGSGTGLLWELRAATRIVPPDRIILSIPPSGEKGRRRRGVWNAFVAYSSAVFPQPLPLNPGSALFVSFDSSWKPKLTGSHGLWGRLDPLRVRRTLRTLLRSVELQEPMGVDD